MINYLYKEMSIDYKYLVSQIPRLSEKEYDIYSNILLKDILNVSIQKNFSYPESIRVPLIGRFLQFQPFNYTDYSDFIDNMGELDENKKTVYVQVDIDIQLHFRDFLKEFAKRDTGIENLFDSSYLLNVQESSIYNYLLLKDNFFETLIIVKKHLRDKIKERYLLYLSKNKKPLIKNLAVNIMFARPRGEFSMNKDLLKIILELKFD